MKLITNYFSNKESSIQCELCPIACVIPKNSSGVCRTRANINGKFYLTNYAQLAELACEPIEKKPLHHYFPGSNTISVGTIGCNMSCSFCQNYEISQQSYPTKDTDFQHIIDEIRKNSAIGICFTFNEPLTWFEYVKDCATEVKKAGYKVILNTNGLINPKPLQELLPLIDAVNLDIKAFSEDFYKKICGAPLQPVLETALQLYASRIHFEISHLVIPGENDSDYKALSKWIQTNLDNNVVLHINAYYPRYLMALPATKSQTILDICKYLKTSGHRYVYGNNIGDQSYHNTYCYNCDNLLIGRNFNTISRLDKAGSCGKCGAYNYIVVN